MQTEQDVIDRARLALAARRPLCAWCGRFRQVAAHAAHGGGTHARTNQSIRAYSLASTLAALFLLGCGDERPPWSGFPIFPPDAGAFELSPELASGLLAAQQAFARQIAGDQAAAGAGAIDPGAANNSAGAPATGTPDDDDNEEREPDDRAERADEAPMNAADGGTQAGRGMESSEAAGGGAGSRALPNWPRRRRPDADAGISAPSGPDGGARTPAAGSGAPPAELSDAGVAPNAADGGATTSSAGSSAPPAEPSDAGGATPAADASTTPSSTDSGPSDPDADGGVS